MRAPAPAVPPDITLADLVHRHMLPAGERVFLVVQGDRLAGLITQTDVMEHRQEDWPTLTVAAAMTPAADLRCIGPGTPIADAVRLLSAENIGQPPVVDQDRAVGLLSRAAIVGYLQLRLQLGVGATPSPGARRDLATPTGAAAH